MLAVYIRILMRAFFTNNLLQDWALLESICTPTMEWLYAALGPPLTDKQVSKQEFVSLMSAKTSLGDPRSEHPFHLSKFTCPED